VRSATARIARRWVVDGTLNLSGHHQIYYGGRKKTLIWLVIYRSAEFNMKYLPLVDGFRDERSMRKRQTNALSFSLYTISFIAVSDAVLCRHAGWRQLSGTGRTRPPRPLISDAGILNVIGRIAMYLTGCRRWLFAAWWLAASRDHSMLLASHRVTCGFYRLLSHRAL